MERRLSAILAADVVGYSRLMEADEADTFERLRTHRTEFFEPAIEKHHGRIFKLMGDGLLVEFASVVDAVECAVALQRGMGERNAGIPADRRIDVRMGLHLGDVIVENDDRHGEGVNLAARLEGLAEPGGICISDQVYAAVAGKLDFSVEDGGEHQVKNIARPVRIWRWHPSRRPAVAGSDAPLPLPEKPSIVVLPFDNMSGDVEQNYFSDGITEDIITDLSKISGLFVIARNSAFTYKGRAVKVQDVSRELGVRYVLEGGVRKVGNRVRITTQLIDGQTGGHVWAERYDRELTDIFALQDEVTQKIVAALALKLSRDERQRIEGRGTNVVGAYDCLLRGRQQMQLFTKAGNAEARLMFERATALDPDFATALACLAMTHMLDYVNRWSEAPDKSLDTAYELANRAVALDEKNPEAHNVLGIVLNWMKDLDRAIAAFERALALDPNYAHAYASLGHVLYYAGEPERSLRFLEQAVRLDPHHPDHFLHFLGLTYFALGRFDEAIAVLERRLIRSPNTDVSRVLLASIYGHLGRHEEARQSWEQVLKVNPAYSLEHRRRILPYRDPADFDRIVDGLRKARCDIGEIGVAKLGSE
jgi:adenylate cyclase